MKNVRFYVENHQHGTMDFYMSSPSGEKTWMFRTEYFSDVIFAKYCCGRTQREIMADKDHSPRNMKLRDRLLRTAKYLAMEAA